MKTNLDRINELAGKQREGVLTSDEQAEQKQLRKDYISEIRGQVVHTFSDLTVIDPLGNDVTPEKLRKIQKQNKEN